MPTRFAPILCGTLFLALAVVGHSPLQAGESGPTEGVFAQGMTIGADHPLIRFSGRRGGPGSPEVTFGYSGARVRIRFRGTSAAVWIKDDSGENYAMVRVDGKPGRKFRLDAGDGLYLLAEGLEDGIHTVEVVRVTECVFGLTRFRGFLLNEGAEVLEWPDEPDRRIEFIGDSITCGYGVEVDDPSLPFQASTENFCLGYACLAAGQLQADYLVVARSGIGMVRNYDGPRDGSENTMPDVYPTTFYLQQEPEWDFRRFTPDVVCLNLGTNDFSTTGVNVDRFIAAYVNFAKGLLERYPEARLVIQQGPMENGEDLRAALDEVVAELRAGAPERVHFLKLSPQGPVGMGADYHPNRAQAKINAAELAAFLSNLMGWTENSPE